MQVCKKYTITSKQILNLAKLSLAKLPNLNSHENFLPVGHIPEG